VPDKETPEDAERHRDHLTACLAALLPDAFSTTSMIIRRRGRVWGG
jgi:hypothetical protein